jgi:hypothetical protein
MSSSPSWFDLRLYPDSTDSPANWWDAIFRRLHLQRLVATGKPSEEELAAQFRKLFTVSSGYEPFSSYSIVGEADYHYLELLGLAMREDSTFQSYLDASRHFAEIRLPGEIPPNFLSDVNQQPEGFMELLEFLEDHRHDTLSRTDLLVYVDLDADDQSLIDAFSSLVRSARVGRRIKPLHFDRWEKFGVLPCFDLRMWGEIVERPFTQVRLAEMIWPHAEFDSGERLRKTTYPYVDAVVTEGTLKRIHELALREKIRNSTP